MDIVYVYADRKHEWNCSEWRCVFPAHAINQTSQHHAKLLDIPSFLDNTPEAQEACSGSQVIIVQRNIFGNALNTIQNWKARGKVIIADFDDAYNHTHPSNVSYPFWMDGKVKVTSPDGKETESKMEPAPITQFKWGLRMCHAATTPSKLLCQDWNKYTDMYYLPNYISLSRYEAVRPTPHEGIIIGWGGSVSHFQSFTESGVLAALKRVCKARPNVKVMICGDKRVFDQVTIPDGQKIFQPFVPVDEWPSVLGNFDIGLAPLQGAYDDRRSWIKPLEYMVMKIPWIASDGAAYHELGEYGRLVKNTPNNWESAMLDMVDHLDRHKQAASEKPYQFGVQQNIQDNVDKIIGIYQAIGERSGICL
jgi:hypothetical protein